MKLVLDTNIYIAAFLSKGLASKIIELGEEEKVAIYASKEILNEVQTRLVRKLKFDENYIREYVDHTAQGVNIVSPKHKLKVIEKDRTDNKILECAIEAKVDLIVSMDKHLLKLKSFKGIGIVHPKTLTWIIPKFFKAD